MTSIVVRSEISNVSFFETPCIWTSFVFRHQIENGERTENCNVATKRSTRETLNSRSAEPSSSSSPSRRKLRGPLSRRKTRSKEVSSNTANVDEVTAEKNQAEIDQASKDFANDEDVVLANVQKATVSSVAVDSKLGSSSTSKARPGKRRMRALLAPKSRKRKRLRAVKIPKFANGLTEMESREEEKKRVMNSEKEEFERELTEAEESVSPNGTAEESGTGERIEHEVSAADVKLAAGGEGVTVASGATVAASVAKKVLDKSNYEASADNGAKTVTPDSDTCCRDISSTPSSSASAIIERPKRKINMPKRFVISPKKKKVEKKKGNGESASNEADKESSEHERVSLEEFEKEMAKDENDNLSDSELRRSERSKKTRGCYISQKAKIGRSAKADKDVVEVSGEVAAANVSKKDDSEVVRAIINVVDVNDNDSDIECIHEEAEKGPEIVEEIRKETEQRKTSSSSACQEIIYGDEDLENRFERSATGVFDLFEQEEAEELDRDDYRTESGGASLRSPNVGSSKLPEHPQSPSKSPKSTCSLLLSPEKQKSPAKSYDALQKQRVSGASVEDTLSPCDEESTSNNAKTKTSSPQVFRDVFSDVLSATVS